MNFKRYFIFPYLILLLVANCYAVAIIWSSEFFIRALSILLACLPMLVFMLSLAIFKPARTRSHCLLEIFLSLLGLVLAYAIDDYVALLLALTLGICGISLYSFWYSKLDRSQDKKIQLGKKLADFVLSDSHGKSKSSHEFFRE